jgi:DNA-binding transcriptional LysR family regulator
LAFNIQIWIDMPPLDWSQIQSFSAVAEHGSLSAAARALHSSQPTLSRHIAALEATLGTRLFERSRTGMVLTVAGTGLMAHAAQMSDVAARFSVPQTDQEPGGTVRITASQVVATFVLPEVLATLRQHYPEISVEIVASNATDNLLRREADIALRMYRPTQPDVIARHITDLPLCAYAAQSYIARRGAPETFEQFRDHDVIGYDRDPQMIEGFRAAGFAVTPDFFAFRTDDQVVYWQMVVAGCGIGFGQTTVGDSDNRVRRIVEAPVATLPMWLTAHPDLHSVPRVRRVFDWLCDHLAKS